MSASADGLGPIRLRGGGLVYREDLAWNVDPVVQPLGWVSAAAVDASGAAVIVQRQAPHMVAISRDGALVSAVDIAGVVEPHGIFITDDGEVLLVDRDGHQVVRVAADGSTEVLFPDDGRFSHPTEIVVHPTTGDYYVADGYGNALIHQFTADGDPVRTWGGHGVAPGQFNVVHTLAVDLSGRILVADRENGRIQAFSPDGECVAIWEGFHRPLGIHVDRRDGTVAVSEGSTRLTVRDPDGEVVAVGRAPNIGHGLTGDDAGALYLSIPAMSAVVKLRAEK